MVHWYKRDPHAAIEGMIGLTAEERGIYNTLLDMLYARDGDVPNDDRLLAIAQQCDVRTWRRVRDSLIAKGKVRVTSAGLLTANRVEVALNEARSFSERQSNRARKRWGKASENNETAMPLPAMRGRNAITTTTTKNTYFGKESERLTPSSELLAREAQKNAVPAQGQPATALVGSAPSGLASTPAKPPPESQQASKKAATETASKPNGGNPERKFTPAEIGKPNGWDWEPRELNGGFYAALNSPEQHAWEEYRGTARRDEAGGWNYPSQWPPNATPPAIAATG